MYVCVCVCVSVVSKFGEETLIQNVSTPFACVSSGWFSMTVIEDHLDWQELARLIADMPDWRFDIDPL